MFDIGFWELTIIAVIALLVIGPERLPKVARTVGLWFGKFSRFVGNIKSDIDREIKADELKRIMDEQRESVGVHKILEETQSAVDELKETSSTLHKDVSDSTTTPNTSVENDKP